MFEKQMEYLKDNPKGYWFKAKLYGWGWVPVRWQGWAVLGVYIAAIAFFALTIDESSPLEEVVFAFLVPVALLTFTLIRICYLKGEKPRWQWGPPDEKK
jgi:hypothetical protein